MISKKFKISICMIVKNEEKNLDRCLKSINELVNLGLAEIIIVDTGSTDKTLEIAKRYTDKVYLHKWKNDFSEARNYSISMAQGEYIFILDADEELESSSAEKVIEFFYREDYKDYGVLYFKEKNFMDSNLKNYGVFTRAFIFRHTNEFRYFGAIHEQPNISGRRVNLDIHILHYGYINDEELQENKFKRNIVLLKEEIKKDPTNLYIRYQSSTSYFAHKDLKEAKAEVDVILNIIKNQKFDKLYLLYYDAAIRIYKENELYEEALSLCNKTLSHQPDFIDILFYKSTILFAMKKYREALYSIENYIELLNEFKNHDIYHDSRFLFYHLNSRDEAISIALVSSYIIKEYNRFIKYINRIEDLSIIRDKLFMIINVYLNIPNYAELIKFYNEKIIKAEDEKIKMIFNYFIYKKLCENKSEYIKYLDNILGFQYTNEEYEKIQHKFIEVFNLDNVDSITARYIVHDLIELTKKYNINYEDIDENAVHIKKAIKFIITRTLNSNQIKSISEDRIFNLIEMYIELGLTLKNGVNMLDEKETIFFELFEKAIYNFERGELLQGVRIIKEAVEEYNDAARMMQLYLDRYIPIYNSCIQMKKQIQDLVQKGDLRDAEILLSECEKFMPKDAENYSVRAVIKIMQNDLEGAKSILEGSIKEYGNNFDLLYNLAYIYENYKETQKAIKYYKKALENTDSLDNKNLIQNKLREIE